MTNYIDNALKVFENNFDLKKEEKVVIITDDRMRDVALPFYEAACIKGNETVFSQFPAIYKSGEEPPALIAQAMKDADVALCVTTASLTHTRAKKEAAATGTRIGTMPGITLSMLEQGAIEADPDTVQKLTDYFTDLLERSSEVKIEKDGEVLTFSINGRKGIPSTGIFREKGQAGNVPSGEAFIAPLEDSANGKIVVDGSIAQIGKVDQPVTLFIENGKLVDATGRQGKELLELLGTEDGKTIAEFGIGTNPTARITGVVLEDEKVFGTVHIAFGSNKPFGGVTEAGVHIDCVVKEPTFWIDGEKVMEKGRVLNPDLPSV
ncbi:Leucyl aminopeptidase (aminopeptidase T) [Alkalibacterium subtropicum]|uniref:Leucyl aminopeptidase (Aminopeptidase T) n=1 Tax=Alkalibacterium subtropicum TaxID=753702 RepID=A0A1I1KCR0_9LACT|nr:aminopeptidase [Alkalibacterium subtropicum]SFC58062.1 Leucyl aminopeptidase (aminopeptidase T) [Alkalibacterium subtropicum]